MVRLEWEEKKGNEGKSLNYVRGYFFKIRIFPSFPSDSFTSKHITKDW